MEGTRLQLPYGQTARFALGKVDRRLCFMDISHEAQMPPTE
ncbi:hypothetical protein NSU_1604 [Novosphingobium pentaromativorans US6-1]|uniref:Uncharacterized protein n=1 Tax=Novosphingobium pentaromativorans US6-1 TaxID=1088721 RepID=G6EB83_9SPHN|nr:hypothetical protein NSU_1604 [Novosphingobium pentaromativorans US6-1]